MKDKSEYLNMIILFSVAMLINMIIALKLGVHVPMQSDAYFYLDLAKNIALGKGYYMNASPWPDVPNMRCLPGWPYLISLILKIFPGVNPDTSMRILSVTLNALLAPIIYLITRKLFNNFKIALLAGLLCVIHPMGLLLGYEGVSEPLFMILAGLGVLFLMQSTACSLKDSCENKAGFPAVNLQMVLGLLLLGISCLVRANFVLFIMFFIVIILFLVYRQDGRHIFRHNLSISLLVKYMVVVLLFVLPTLGWAFRNYTVSGHFPVISTHKGQTFYGGNNARVAHDFYVWGYWIFPDEIPGETRFIELAKKMTDYEVDHYYTVKAKEFINNNMLSMPGLMVGKLVRAYIPVPWKFSIKAAAASTYRWALYLFAIRGLYIVWQKLNVIIKSIWSGMLLTNLCLVLIFWGCARFSYEIEPFLIPFFAYGLYSSVTKVLGSGIEVERAERL